MSRSWFRGGFGAVSVVRCWFRLVPVLISVVPFGSVWFRLVPVGSVWFRLVPFGSGQFRRCRLRSLSVPIHSVGIQFVACGSVTVPVPVPISCTRAGAVAVTAQATVMCCLWVTEAVLLRVGELTEVVLANRASPKLVRAPALLPALAVSVLSLPFAITLMSLR